MAILRNLRLFLETRSHGFDKTTDVVGQLAWTWLVVWSYVKRTTRVRGSEKNRDRGPSTASLRSNRLDPKD